MGDLSEFQPKTSKTVELIYAHYKAVGDAEPRRGYLGASIVGHACDRFLWYSFRGVVREDTEGRMYRLWQTGHLEEPRLVADLRAIGCEVFTHDAKGEQFAIYDFSGHFSGHLDGVVKGVHEAPANPHVGEFKTHKHASFSDLKKHGVKVSKPQHWAQMQAYMGHMKLTRALYLARDKDTDELWSERIDFDRAAFNALMARAKRIIDTAHAPVRCSTRADFYVCKMCPAQALCWGLDEKRAVPVPGVTCRTCLHATAETGEPGTSAPWSCARYCCRLPTTDVGEKCPAHLTLPSLVSFADATDSDDDWIEFTNHDGGAKWRHGGAEGEWTSAQLTLARGPLDPPRAPDPTPASTHSSATGVEAGPPATTASPSDEDPHNHDDKNKGRCHGYDDTSRCCDDHAPGSDYCEAHAHQDPDYAAGRAAAEAALLTIDLDDIPLDDLPLVSRYPWAESEKSWSGPVGELEAALLDLGAWGLPPRRRQDDEKVNAAEFVLDDGSEILVVNYKAEKQAAIWRGKS